MKNNATASILLAAALFFTSLTGFGQTKYVQAYASSVIVQNELPINKVVHNFKLESKKWIKDCESTAFVFEHVKSDAEIVYLQNDDENKVFSINLATPVHDNTGF